MIIRSLYYIVKPIIPRKLQLSLRQTRGVQQRKKFSNTWPIDEDAGNTPNSWNGWPDNKQFALVFTHDVESEIGLDRCRKLAQIEKGYGFRSVFIINLL